MADTPRKKVERHEHWAYCPPRCPACEAEAMIAKIERGE